ncbi:MAG: hypothetical protein ACYDCL_09675 [Myxococcales bacterium]
MSPRAAFALCFLLGVAPACVSEAFRHAEAADSVDGWRAFLANHGDRSDEFDHARKRLEALSWQAALAENTPRAYRRFAEDFEDSDHREEAEARLAALRYQTAERGAASGLQIFLEDEPEGTLAQHARAKLADLEFAAASKAQGAAPIELYLARFPEGPHLQEARQLADARAFEAAEAGGILGLTDYVRRYPEGKHRGEAEDRLLASRIGALIAEERFDEAAAALKVGSKLAEHDRLAARLDAARRRAQLATAEAIAGVSHAELESVQEQAFALSRPDRAAVGQLAAGLEAPDPASRWRAAAALGATGSIWALDPLLAAASASHFWKVRLTAAQAALDLVGGWSEEVAQDEVARRVLELRPLDASAEISDRIGLLEAAVRDVPAARAAFAQSRHWAPGDLLALEQGRRLGGEAGDAAVRLALAHELVEAAYAYADDRLRDPQMPPLLADRQLCGVVDIARAGVAALSAAGAEAAAWLPATRARAERLGELLVETERRGAQDDTAFVGCAAGAAPGAPPARQLAAVAALAPKLGAGAEGEVVRAILEEAAAHDGSKAVRDAAAEALAGRR